MCERRPRTDACSHVRAHCVLLMRVFCWPFKKREPSRNNITSEARRTPGVGARGSPQRPQRPSSESCRAKPLGRWDGTASSSGCSSGCVTVGPICPRAKPASGWRGRRAAVPPPGPHSCALTRGSGIEAGAGVEPAAPGRGQQPPQEVCADPCAESETLQPFQQEFFTLG